MSRAAHPPDTALAAAVSAAAVLLFGCGPRQSLLPDMPPAPAADAPYELASDSDLSELRHQYEALEERDPERRKQRVTLADEYAHRVRSALDQRERHRATESFRKLLSLWTAAELRAGPPDLARYRDTATLVRTAYARSGADIETATALAALILMVPNRAGAYRSELDEIFAFADELTTNQFGEGAQRARPIEILENIAEVLPSKLVIDRLVALYLERQRALESHVKRRGADIALLRVHGPGALRTTWSIVRLLALADRLDEAPGAIAGLSGLGDDSTLRRQLVAALAGDATSWIALADAFRDDSGDTVAVLQVCVLAIRRFPDDARLYRRAAEAARSLENAPLAIRLYERAIELQPDNAAACSELARLYEYQISVLSFGDRPHSARKFLRKFETFHQSASKILGKPLEPDPAHAYAIMGRGLVSLGELDQARSYLERSLQLRPTLAALEYLGTVALKQENYQQAISHLEKALELPGSDSSDDFDRIKLLRLAADAHAGAGNDKTSAQYRQSALRAWNALEEKYELEGEILAETKIERGKILWQLGKRDRALELFDSAIDAHPDGASVHADVVSFLIVRDQYRHALDTYHRARGNPEIDDYYKVYMSLWIVAEARRQGRDIDPVAHDYLASRTSRLWCDALARYAIGDVSIKPLQKLATTRSRQAELLYYTATLGAARDDPDQVRRLLEGVVASDMVLFFEYDMAKRWLSDRPSQSP